MSCITAGSKTMEQNAKNGHPDDYRPGIESRDFWEKRALDYHHPFHDNILNRTGQVIDFIEKAGFTIEDSQILDVGSGPGTFSLPLALKGAKVTALDISENMLKRLASEANGRGAPAITTVRASWKEFDPAASGYLNAFDGVISSLSLATETERDLLKMEECSKGWCICVAAGRLRCCGEYEKLLGMFDLPLRHRPDIRDLREAIEKIGRAYLYKSFPVNKHETVTAAELSEDVAKRLETNGKIPDRSRIRAAVSSLFGKKETNGKIDLASSADRGVLIWNPYKKEK